MALTRPTLGALIDQAKNEINALVPGADARMRVSIFSVFASVWGALTDGLYSALNYLSRQLFVMTADIEYLTLIGQSYGVDQLSASAATGSADLVGAAGTSVFVGTVLTRSDGLTYQTTAGQVFPASGSMTVPIISQTTGAMTNANAGVALQCPTVGVTSGAVSAGAVSGGSDDESVDGLRARILFRLQNPPGAGTLADWTRWTFAQEAAVTRVWPLALPFGAGSVGVVYAQDNAAVVPPPSSIAAMTKYLRGFEPIGATIYVFAPTLDPINFTISGIADPATRVNVIAELTDLLYREAYPGNTIPLSHIHKAISEAPGEYDHQLLSPTAALTFGEVPPVFQIGTMGVVTWQ